MADQLSLVATAEAAFIADLSDRQMNRIVDEDLVPDVLFERHGKVRRFTRLCSAFAKFYFDTEATLMAPARREVLIELTERIERLQHLHKHEVLSLRYVPADMDWKVTRAVVAIDVTPYVAHALVRAKEVDQADTLITVDSETMGGVPVFAGSRVPVEVVVASINKGISIERLNASYSFLTPAHIAAARTYLLVHPRRGRPKSLAETNPDVQPHTKRIVRNARA